MTINDDVPREFDKIQVLYVLENGERVWWPTTVIHAREYDTPGAVKGTGTVEFAAFRKSKRSVQDVQFLADRTVNTNNGESSWRTSAEAADAGDGDGGEASWDRAVGKRARSDVPSSHTTPDSECPPNAQSLRAHVHLPVALRREERIHHRHLLRYAHGSRARPDAQRRMTIEWTR